MKKKQDTIRDFGNNLESRCLRTRNLVLIWTNFVNIGLGSHLKHNLFVNKVFSVQFRFKYFPS